MCVYRINPNPNPRRSTARSHKPPPGWRVTCVRVRVCVRCVVCIVCVLICELLYILAGAWHGRTSLRPVGLPTRLRKLRLLFQTHRTARGSFRYAWAGRL